MIGSVAYIEGMDRDANVPLWGIYPLDSRVGIRIDQPVDQPRWGAECTVRMVDGQNKVSGVGSGVAVDEQATAGFTTVDIRGYAKVTQSLTLIAGVENVGDRVYQEHLDSRFELNTSHSGGIFRPGMNYCFVLAAEY